MFCGWSPMHSVSAGGYVGGMSECWDGYSWHISPICSAVANYNGTITIRECYIFVWNGSTYVARYGFANYSGSGFVPGRVYWFTRGGSIVVNGYNVSAEVCAGQTISGYQCIACVQTPQYVPGS